MLQNLPKSELALIVKAHTEKITEDDTRSARISLKQLAKFVDQIKALDADGVRIYFTRPKSYGVDQISLAIVPTTNKGEDDIFHSDDTILVLAPGGENSGLCPPGCGSSLS